MKNGEMEIDALIQGRILPVVLLFRLADRLAASSALLKVPPHRGAFNSAPAALGSSAMASRRLFTALTMSEPARALACSTSF